MSFESLVPVKGKICTSCGAFREWSDYANHKHTKDGKQSWCRYCKTRGMQKLRERKREQEHAHFIDELRQYQAGIKERPPNPWPYGGVR